MEKPKAQLRILNPSQLLGLAMFPTDYTYTYNRILNYLYSVLLDQIVFLFVILNIYVNGQKKKDNLALQVNSFTRTVT